MTFEVGNSIIVKSGIKDPDGWQPLNERSE